MLEDGGETSFTRPPVLRDDSMGPTGYSASVWPHQSPSLGSSAGARISEREIRDESLTHQGTLFVPSVPVGVTERRRTFAYLICINEYKSTEVPNLNGCRNDGDKFAEFLGRNFPVPAPQIQRLDDAAATFDGIMSLFDNASSNHDIQKGDLVIFFYAGHGTRTKAPENWVTDDGLVELICPHDIDTNNGRADIHGIPDFVIGSTLGDIANTRGANVLLIFDSCHSAGIARDKNAYLAPRYSNSKPVPESVLSQLLLDYPERGNLLGQAKGSPTSPFTLLAACGKRETAHEECSPEGAWTGAFTEALIALLEKLPWHNLSYSTLCKSFPKLPYQTPECIGESNRVVFTLESARDEGLYFDIEKRQDGHYTVKGAGLALGIGVKTKFTIRGHDSQNLGYLIVDDVRVSQCRARADFQGDYRGDIPNGAKAILHYWSLCDGPLRVAVESDVERPRSTSAIDVVEDASKAHVVLAEREGGLVLDRQDPLIAFTTGVRTIKLPKGMDFQGLQNVLAGVARFNHHLLRKGPGLVNGSTTAELYRVQKGADGRFYHEDKGDAANLILNGTADIQFRDDAKFGIIIKNNSEHTLFPYLFYFDPSDYSITCVYLSPKDCGAPLPPQIALPIGFGESSTRPLRFYLHKEEKSDVGFLRLFLSTARVAMENIQQLPLSRLIGRHFMPEPEDPDIWDVQTIVVRTSRDNSKSD